MDASGGRIRVNPLLWVPFEVMPLLFAGVAIWTVVDGRNLGFAAFVFAMAIVSAIMDWRTAFKFELDGDELRWRSLVRRGVVQVVDVDCYAGSWFIRGSFATVYTRRGRNISAWHSKALRRWFDERGIPVR